MLINVNMVGVNTSARIAIYKHRSVSIISLSTNVRCVGRNVDVNMVRQKCIVRSVVDPNFVNMVERNIDV
jgi:glutamate racemase